MRVLAPHISCICTPDELQDVIAQEYKEIYILTLNGVFKHHILRGTNRYVRTKVTTIPGYTEPKIEEGMNFLPAGKIPHAIYEQVRAFFIKVMEVKNSDVEAMIHVLYNAERGYHLGVPPQTVSKASASYDWNYIPAGTSIIVDIHSHNTMGAFFSGTDDRDDRGNISFSGVFGKLKDREPMTCWRFNYYDKKYTADASDLFEAPPPAPSVEIPADWIENVNVQTYSPPKYNGGTSGQGNVVRSYPVSQASRPSQTSGQTHDQLSKWRYPTTTTTPQRQNQGAVGNPNDRTTGLSFDDMDGGDDLIHFFGSELPENYPAAVNARGNVIPTVSGPSDDHIYADEHANAFNLASVDDGDLEAMYNAFCIDPRDRPDPNFGVNHLREDTHFEEGEADPVGKSSGELALLHEASTSTDADGEPDPQYSAIATIHGVDVADAWWDISMQMSTLDGQDELNQELICDMAGLMTDEGQLKVFRELFDRLSKDNKSKIETHGF